LWIVEDLLMTFMTTKVLCAGVYSIIVTTVSDLSYPTQAPIFLSIHSLLGILSKDSVDSGTTEKKLLRDCRHHIFFFFTIGLNQQASERLGSRLPESTGAYAHISDF
jgi:hypothetical protein